MSFMYLRHGWDKMRAYFFYCKYGVDISHAVAKTIKIVAEAQSHNIGKLKYLAYNECVWFLNLKLKICCKCMKYRKI